MKFEATPLPGVFVIEPEPINDERGFFARLFSQHEFAQHSLNPGLSQCSLSYNARAGTLRGLHYQAQPYGEAKLVRCTRGAIYDVALDLRQDSPAFKQWFAVELNSDNHRQLYLPEGCAHGFQTLIDHAEVYYHIAAPYVAAAARGVRWDDPAFNIAWPRTVSCISERDRAYADFR